MFSNNQVRTYAADSPCREEHVLPVFTSGRVIQKVVSALLIFFQFAYFLPQNAVAVENTPAFSRSVDWTMYERRKGDGFPQLPKSLFPHEEVIVSGEFEMPKDARLEIPLGEWVEAQTESTRAEANRVKSEIEEEAYEQWLALWGGKSPERIHARIVQHNDEEVQNTYTMIQLTGYDPTGGVVNVVSALLGPPSVVGGDYERREAIEADKERFARSWQQRLGIFEMFNPAAWITRKGNEISLGTNSMALLKDAVSSAASGMITIQGAGSEAGPLAGLHIIKGVRGLDLVGVFDMITVGICWGASALLGLVTGVAIKFIAYVIEEVIKTLVESTTIFTLFSAINTLFYSIAGAIAAVSVSAMSVAGAVEQAGLQMFFLKVAALSGAAFVAGGVLQYILDEDEMLYKRGAMKELKSMRRFTKIANYLNNVARHYRHLGAAILAVLSSLTGVLSCIRQYHWPKIVRGMAPVTYKLVKSNWETETFVEGTWGDLPDSHRILSVTFDRAQLEPYIHRNGSQRAIVIRGEPRLNAVMRGTFDGFTANTVDSRHDPVLPDGHFAVDWLPDDVNTFYGDLGPRGPRIVAPVNLPLITGRSRSDLNPDTGWMTEIIRRYFEVICDVTATGGRDSFTCSLDIATYNTDTSGEIGPYTRFTVNGPRVQ